MKDLTIRAAAIRRELVVLLVCAGVAFLVNLYAIVAYDTKWTELFTTLPVVLLLGVAFYVVMGVLRLLVRGVRLLLTRRTASVD